ncbi:MAG TPA: DUF805 domain-containing protein, partial [Rhodanobacteraceae bacterium]
SRRSEYWNFVLWSLIVTVVLAVCDAAVGRVTGSPIELLRWVYTIAVFVPSLAVAVRRLHDTNRSGWWVLLAIVPVVGLVLLWFLAQDSDGGANRYGQNPKLAIA